MQGAQGMSELGMACSPVHAACMTSLASGLTSFRSRLMLEDEL